MAGGEARQRDRALRRARVLAQGFRVALGG